MIRIVAGFEIAQGGLNPLSRVREPVGPGECNGCVAPPLPSCEAVLHGFAIVDRFAIVTEGDVRPTRVVVDKAEFVVNRA